MKFEKLKQEKKKIFLYGLILAVVLLVSIWFKYQNIELSKEIMDYDSYRLEELAMYQSEDGANYTEITTMPSSGYAINEEKSYCTLNNNKDTEVKLYTENGKHIFENLIKNDKCYVYFDKKDTIIPTISNVSTTVTTSTIKVTVTASDNVGVTEYWYQIGTNTAVKSTSNTYTFTSLTAGTAYSIKVYVKDAAGNQSEIMTTSAATTADTTIPTISSVSTTVTTSTIKVTVAASDNVGVTEYWYQIGTNTAIKSTSNTYTFSGLAAGVTYSIKVYVKDAAGNQSATTAKSVTTTANTQTSSSIIAGLSYKTTAPSFSQVATTDEGIYRVSDGMYGGYSYYWRGAATTNYVKFAGFCWRIIRINGDGSMRLIYDGTTCHANGTSTTDSIISNVAYNSNSTRSEYVGWKYTTGLQRPSSITSGTDSPIKTVLESWYTTNITNKGYDGKVATGKFCNDRNVQSGSTWVSTGSSFNYAGYNRINTGAPTLSCATLDTYSLKVGLITADEVMYAGAAWDYTNNTSYYLYNGQNYWTMSPYDLWSYGSSAETRVFYVYASGSLGSWNVGNAYGVRPVINLASSTTFAAGGTGTQTNPYVVQ